MAFLFLRFNISFDYIPEDIGRTREQHVAARTKDAGKCWTLKVSCYNLRHDSVVNKYQGHCDKLVFFILDNTSLDILHEKSVSIVFATELLQEENISDQFKSRVSALISESVQLEQMLETFLDNDLSVKLNGLGSQGMKENDTEYLEMVDLLHRIRPVD